MKKEGNNVEKYNSVLLTLILLMLCVLTIIILIPEKCNCMYASLVQNHGNSVIGGVDLSIDPNEENNSKLQDSNDEQGVAISGIAAITFNKGEKKIPVDFYNPEKNADMYYQTFELKIFVNGKYETLYTSGLVEPGKHIEHITLSRELEAGVYQAVVHVQPYYMDEAMTPTNNADIKTKVIVK